MTLKPWKVLETRRPRQDYRLDRCQLPNGNTIEKLVLEYGTWATIVALTRAEEVILIRQYRHGIGRVIWEFPGGCVDPGESPLEGAKRELLEESGYTGSFWVPTGAISPNPDNHNNLIHTFLATDVEKVSAQHLDPNEEIEVFPTPIDQVIRMALEGEFLQAMQISALFFALAQLKRIC